MALKNFGRISRRQFIKTTALAGAGIAMTPLFAPYVKAAETMLKLGYVSPQTGPLAAFAEADEFILGQFTRDVKNGLDINGTNYAVEVIVKDSQSNPNRAAEVAKELIVDDEIDLMLVASTPETTNPVSTQCEIEEVPCISTMAPWQPWFIGRQGNPADPASWTPFKHTFHYFWGLEDVIAVFTNMWNQLETNKMVGALFPNDGDGNAWGDPNVGFPPVLARQRLQAGRSRPLPEPDRRFFRADHRLPERRRRDRHRRRAAARLHHLLDAGQPEGLQAESRQRRQGILFPVALEALGKTGNNLSSEVWWSPSHPFKSSLNGQTAAELAAGFTAATGRQWTQPIGFIHSLLEFAVDTLKRAADPTDPAAIVEVHLQGRPADHHRPDQVRPGERAAVCPRQSLQDAAGRRPVEAQGRRQVRHHRRRQPDRDRSSGRRQDGTDRLISRRGGALRRPAFHLR